jgi:hypothetical protein
MKERYINPFTDFGFKKIFGEEANKDSLKYYWDLKNVMDTAVEEAVDNTKIEIAKKMLKRNVMIEIIAEDTGLTIEQVQKLAK